MGAYIMLSFIGLPCMLALIFFMTPRGKEWLENN